jgi:amino acid transporter
MVSTIIFTVMVLLALIALIIASVTISIAASEAYGSSAFNSETRVRNAHRYLTIGAVLGWTALVVLATILIVAVFAGGFSTTEVSEALLNSANYSRADYQKLLNAEKDLKSGLRTSIIVFVVLIIVAIITLIVGILAAVGAGQLENVRERDGKARSAYNYAVAAAVAGIASIGLMVVAVITYASVRGARAKELQKIEESESREEIEMKEPREDVYRRARSPRKTTQRASNPSTSNEELIRRSVRRQRETLQEASTRAPPLPPRGNV